MVKDTNARSMWDMASGALSGEGLARDELRAECPLAGLAAAGQERARAHGGDPARGRSAEAAATVLFPVGWVVVISGPGAGHAYALRPGASQIGRGRDQAVSLDFGDLAISREGHAAIVYDEASRCFGLSFGGKSNLVRLNGRPVLGPETLRHGDRIRIGETTMMLSALCGPDFVWEEA